MTDIDAYDDSGTARPPQWWLDKQKQEAMKIKDVKTGQYIKKPKPVKKPKK